MQSNLDHFILSSLEVSPYTGMFHGWCSQKGCSESAAAAHTHNDQTFGAGCSGSKQTYSSPRKSWNKRKMSLSHMLSNRNIIWLGARIILGNFDKQYVLLLWRTTLQSCICTTKNIFQKLWKFKLCKKKKSRNQGLSYCIFSIFNLSGSSKYHS